MKPPERSRPILRLCWLIHGAPVIRGKIERALGAVDDRRLLAESAVGARLLSRQEKGGREPAAHGVIKEVTDGEALRERAVEQHLKALRAGKTSLMISPRHEEARKVASVVRRRLEAEGAIGLENYPVMVLCRMDLGPESCRDLLHYVPGRVVGFHTRAAGGFKPGEKWTVRRTNCETVTLERNGQVRQFKPSAKGKWDVLVSSTMKVSVGDQIRVTAGFREEKNVFKNNDVAQVREVTDSELVLHDGRLMRRDGARIDQGVCITSHASQYRTVEQVVKRRQAITHCYREPACGGEY